MSEERLDRLRRRIRNLDAALLGLMAERMELAREVGQEKRGAGIPLRDFEVEKRVLARAAASAEALGLAPELARGVMRQLVEEACRVQEIDRYSAYSGDSESILVVGGAGRWGSGWCASSRPRGIACWSSTRHRRTGRRRAGAAPKRWRRSPTGLATLWFRRGAARPGAGVVEEIAALGFRGVRLRRRERQGAPRGRRWMRRASAASRSPAFIRCSGPARGRSRTRSSACATAACRRDGARRRALPRDRGDARAAVARAPRRDRLLRPRHCRTS